MPTLRTLSQSDASLSKYVLQSELYFTARTGARDRAVVRRDYASARQAEIDKIKRVEKLRPELNLVRLPETKILQNPEIQIFQARPLQNVPPGSAVAETCRSNKSGGV